MSVERYRECERDTKITERAVKLKENRFFEIEKESEKHRDTRSGRDRGNSNGFIYLACKKMCNDFGRR